jgi:hypothetical protein
MISPTAAHSYTLSTLQRPWRGRGRVFRGRAGWITGVNVRRDYRWVGADPQRTTAAAAEVNGWNPTGSKVPIPDCWEVYSARSPPESFRYKRKHTRSSLDFPLRPTCLAQIAQHGCGGRVVGT